MGTSYQEHGVRGAELQRQGARSLIELHILVADVRDGFGPGEYAAYLEWATHYLGWAADTTKKAARVGKWLRDIRQFADEVLANLAGAPRYTNGFTGVFVSSTDSVDRLIHLVPASIGKLDQLQRIPIEHLKAFAGEHPECFGPHAADRNAIRLAVNEFLTARGLQESGSSAIPAYSLPTAEQLMLELHDETRLRAMKPSREWTYAEAFASRAINAAVCNRDTAFLRMALAESEKTVEAIRGILLSGNQA
jgi:hypothetical protein